MFWINNLEHGYRRAANAMYIYTKSLLTTTMTMAMRKEINIFALCSIKVSLLLTNDVRRKKSCKHSPLAHLSNVSKVQKRRREHTTRTQTQKRKKQIATRTTNILFGCCLFENVYVYIGPCRTDSMLFLCFSVVYHILLSTPWLFCFRILFSYFFFILNSYSFQRIHKKTQRQNQTKQQMSDWFPLNYSVIENCFISSIDWRWTFLGAPLQTSIIMLISCFSSVFVFVIFFVVFSYL